MRKNKGITLIALVITIIVLLILAGISIATLTGANGVLTKASTAKEETKKAEYKEVLELIGNGLKPEKVIENLSTKEFMDRYEKAIREKAKQKGTLEGATVERKSDEKIWVTTQEGYVYEITENEVKLLGEKGEDPPPNLQQTDIEFKLTPNGYTNQNVTVEIIPQISTEGFTLQYSINEGENWSDYKTPIILEENVTIYTKLVNNLEEEGAAATKEIDIIDKDLPEKATITFNKTSLSAGEELTATVAQKDKGTSGVDIANCRYIFTNSEEEIGASTSSKYTGGNFSNETQTLTLNSDKVGTYYLHVLTVDKAGNKRETISRSVTIEDTTIPNEATITFNKESATVGESVIATITQTDDQSGVDIANCKYIFTTTSTAIGTSDVSKYSGGGFTKAVNDKITLNCTASGTYYLHVLTVDKAGNKKETISRVINITAYEYVLCANGIFNRNPDIDYHSAVYKSCFSLINNRYHRIILHQGDKQITGAVWQVKRVGTTATINYDFTITGVNNNIRPCYFFACNTPPARGVSLSGPYAPFLNSISFTSQKSEAIPYQGAMEIAGMEENFYVGFMICDQGYGNGALGLANVDMNSLSITFK